MEVRVYSPHGNEFTIEAKEESITIQQIKKQIQKKYGYLANEMDIWMLEKDEKESADKNKNKRLENEFVITRQFLNEREPEFYADNLFFESIGDFLNEKADYSELKKRAVEDFNIKNDY